VGMGEKFGEEATKPTTAGIYGRMGPLVKHFAFARGETDIQVHGQGPWVVVCVNAAADPRRNN